MKPKSNTKNQPEKDRCQTPHYALDPILPYISKNWVIWESACGDGQIVDKLRIEGYTKIIASDILGGVDYFSWEPENYNMQLTNPPYSMKYEWMKQACHNGKPFALLMPSDSMFSESGINLITKYDIEIIIVYPRINFKMPNKGYSGSGAQMSTAWFCRGLNIGKQVSYFKRANYPDGQPNLFNSLLQP